MYKCNYTDETLNEITKFFVDGTFKVRIFLSLPAHCTGSTNVWPTKDASLFKSHRGS